MTRCIVAGVAHSSEMRAHLRKGASSGWWVKSCSTALMMVATESVLMVPGQEKNLDAVKSPMGLASKLLIVSNPGVVFIVESPWAMKLSTWTLRSGCLTDTVRHTLSIADEVGDRHRDWAERLGPLPDGMEPWELPNYLGDWLV